MSEKIFWLLIERYLYTARTTIGRLYFEYPNYVQLPLAMTREYFCYTLEDTARGSNIKVYGETCLPGGLVCNVSRFENPHYGKTLILHTESDNRTILFPPLKWTDCLFHNGIAFDQTLGCVLVGAKLVHPVYVDKIVTMEPRVWSAMKAQLRTRVDKAIADGYTIKAKFVNLDQTS